MKETLAGPASFEEMLQKSRFLARAWPITSVAAAHEQIALCTLEDASHHCWAYRFGDQYRWADAGEPSGSAGRPILQAIDGQAVSQCLVVVTRWFGGIKLGVGGLVRAYGGCAAECLRLSVRRPLVDLCRIRIEVSFAHESLLRQALSDLHGQIVEDQYGDDGFACVVELPAVNQPALMLRLTDATRGRARMQTLGAT